jgi:PAT family beta-lactamase induction signal transducer AmpG
MLAIIGGFCELPVDGFYLDALDTSEQAFFVGVKTACVRLGVIFTVGLLVMITGKYGEIKNNIRLGWSLFFGALCIIFIAVWFWHFVILPHPKVKKANTHKQSMVLSYMEPFKAFFTQPQTVPIVFFTVVYRAGEGLLSRMGIPFLLENPETGGLGIPVSTVGLYSTFSLIAIIIGGILGGVLLKNCSLRKTMIFLSLCMTLPNFIYVFLAHFQPLNESVINLSFIPNIFGVSASWEWKINLYAQIGVAVEAFGYGLGFSAFVYYVCCISNRSQYKASFFAISTGLQTLGWALVGTFSGYLQEYIGYKWLFIHSIIWSVPGIACLIYISKFMNRMENNDEDICNEEK